MNRTLARPEKLSLAALTSVGVITFAWWAVALWPVSGTPPAWLEMTRRVCFGAVDSGLPSHAGWLMLIGEPIAMTFALGVIAGRSLRTGLGVVMASTRGRAVLAGIGLVIAAGAATASTRLLPVSRPAVDQPVAEAEPLDAPAPPLELISQSGKPVSLSQLGGRVVLVGFAYSHCSTVCPTIVQELLAAREQSRSIDPALVIVTLDPWRDTPARLPAIANQWRLGDRAFLLGGSVTAVERTLDAWQVARARDSLTGEITHGTSVFVVNPRGRLAYRALPFARVIADAARMAGEQP